MVIYFGIVLFFMLVVPAIGRVLEAHRRPGSLEHAQQVADAAVQEAVARVSARQGHPFAANPRIYFPVGTVVLAAGFWLLVREEE